jgi:hypothetical protein
VVRQELETFLEQVQRDRDVPLPKYVEQELRDYLKCGIWAYGFSVLRCTSCHEHLLVALSCKGRTVCPSCGARRMCNQAAHLVDRVLPDVPFRQWVAVVPYELRYAMAARPDVLRAVVAIVHSEVFRSQRTAARKLGEPRVQTGAVIAIQRMGGSLNLHVHIHALFFDGVFVERSGRLVFVRLPPPSALDLAHIAERIFVRTVRFLRRAGLLSPDGAGEQSSERSAQEACRRLAMSLGRLGRLSERGAVQHDKPGQGLFEAPRGNKLAANVHGVNLEAGVVLERHNRTALERLCRYLLRPAVSLERMRITLTGQVTYKLKYPRNGQTHLVLTPLELLGRVAGLIAPPRLMHLRYAGVLAPHHRLRSQVVCLAVPIRDRAAAQDTAHRTAGTSDAAERPSAVPRPARRTLPWPLLPQVRLRRRWSTSTRSHGPR